MAHTDKLTRRRFLAGTAAMMVAPSCAPPVPKEHTIYDILSRHDLRGQDGKPINIPALRQAGSGKFTTATFSFNGCVDYCPLTNATLSRMGKGRKNMVHMVVSVTPEFDGANQEARDAFMQSFRNMGVTGDIIILYPKHAEGAIKIQSEAGLIVNKENPRLHSGQIVLYAPDGKYMGKKDGLYTKNFDDWNARMNEWMQKDRGR
jgi:cytochrome oxidase Cu insertion factor (SCO1/SenC/PrrC family)